MSLVKGAYPLEPLWRTTFTNPARTTPQEAQNLLRPTLMNGVGQLEPVWKTDFINPARTTPQAPQNLLRPTLMNGLRIGKMPSGRTNMIAGQYKGRLSNDLGSCLSCNTTLGNVSLDLAYRADQQMQNVAQNAPDLSALKARGQEYYKQGMALVDQGHAWAAEAMNTFAAVSDIDPSLIDWQGLATQGMYQALNYLEAQTAIGPSGGSFQPPDLPDHTSGAYFQAALAEATQYTNDIDMLQKQQAQYTALQIIKQQQSKTTVAPSAKIGVSRQALAPTSTNKYVPVELTLRDWLTSPRGIVFMLVLGAGGYLAYNRIR